MKRFTAILLTAVLVLTLVSCSAGTGAGPSGSAPGAAPSDTAPPPVSPDQSPPPESGIGYLTDKAEHFNRKPYRIAYICLSAAEALQQGISNNLEKFGKVLNYEYTMYSANMDYDGLVNQMQVYADQGYQGLIVGADDSVMPRIYEVGKELDIPFVAESTSFLDASGSCIWPSVAQDQYANGAECVQWLADNYNNYWTDQVDLSKIGLIVIDFTLVNGIHERAPGAHDAFVKDFPEASGNYYVADLATLSTGPTAQGASDLASGIMATHSEIAKWFVVALVDDWAIGAARAVESLNKGQDALVVSVQSDAFIKELESGNADSIYVAACAISPAEFSSYMAANIVTILEGRATAETIWPEWKAPGSNYACMKIKGTMITKDTYKDWEKNTSFDTLTAGLRQG
ncbi:L-arabinose transport system substrate-binding protein [Sporobacter termitidis DSM 10068]|uniref:L-arabinose transport system substrate-binding protein n=1 Tax=Sporobacter termitidis DSM 10068 TaxID=1123282 RepID=A0A1M5Z157_9FIRM|nr:substrate-binding domain-containing protein [Sporobacter termitidis]SHI17798.1 L-arabinose transport system substrate-binding protein [Sporobacter termitidis DSM 10068]